MKQKSIFEIVLMVVFFFFIAYAVLGFAGIAPLPGGGKDEENIYLGSVVIWGTAPSVAISDVIEAAGFEKKVKVSYVQKNTATFDRDLTEALANGVGPDIVLLSEDLILRYQNRIQPIPYATLPIDRFKALFIQEAELYLGNDGIAALPLTVDPMVMYWNRDLFSSAGIINPPTSWSQFIDEVVPKITMVDYGAKIKRSAIAFGEFDNVTHAKDIISLLILQAGNPIILVGADGALEVVLEERFGYDVVPAQEALKYYTQFSDPSQDVYSWNRSLPLSESAFLSSDLAVYFGYASEYKEMKRKNPHLNFDVADMPQREVGAKQKITFGKMRGLSVLKATKNPNAAFAAVMLMSGPDFISTVSRLMGVPPARKDLLSKKPEQENALFYQLALQSRAWLDPLPETTSAIFRGMTEDILSKRANFADTIETAARKLENALRIKR